MYFSTNRLLTEIALYAGWLVMLSTIILALSGFSLNASENKNVSSNWFVTEENEVRLISATTGIGNQKTVQLGIQFKLKKGWKIYWHSPGDAGFPPRLTWGKSKNIDSTEFYWPTPTRFEAAGFQTIGYKNDVVFPIKVNVSNPSDSLVAKAELDYLTCKDICIPYRTLLSLKLFPETENASKHFQLISKYISKVPRKGPALGLSITDLKFLVNKSKQNSTSIQNLLRVVAESDTPFLQPDIFIKGPDSLTFGLPQKSPTVNSNRVIFLVPIMEEGEIKNKTPSLIVTLKDRNRAIQQELQTNLDMQSPANTLDRLPPIYLILLVALLGGLVLNLMPCVLPVISLKLLQFISPDNDTKKEIRFSFAASSLGILCSFLLIASVLTALKIAGNQIGWGIQFQYPWFIVSLAIIVSFFAYNLWGLFEITLPQSFYTFTLNSDRNLQNNSRFLYNFLSGVFATILATPCSAPFLGTAVSFALAGSTLDMFSIFFVLGLGMSLPFILIALFPSVASLIPRPGSWMIRLKQLLGIALAGTAIWLLYILSDQTNPKFATLVLVLLIIIGGLLSLKKITTNKMSLSINLIVLVLICITFLMSLNHRHSRQQAQRSNHDHLWIPFKPERIPSLINEGKIVVVDITAKWCITCQVNKYAVLDKRIIFETFSGSGGVVTMRGDWTQPNPDIAKYLKDFGRYGIPFNVVYGPFEQDGLVLPELLTTSRLKSALKKASGKN